MMTSRPLPAAHLTTAIRALLDHIDTHRLGIPLSIEPGPHAIGVTLYSRHLDAWLDSVTITAEDSHIGDPTPAGVRFLHVTADGTLPDTGVRVHLATAAPIPPARLAGVSL